MRDWKQWFQTMSLGFFMLLLLHQVFILKVTAEEPLVAKPRCQSKCGNVTIPFPFGIGGENCYLNQTFEIDCKDDKPILRKIDRQVLEISVENGTMRVNHSVFSVCGQKNLKLFETVNLADTPFFFSKSANMVTGLGCNNIIAVGYGNSSLNITAVGGCISFCDPNKYLKKEDASYSCPGIKCCQTGIPSSFQFLYISVDPRDKTLVKEGNQEDCRYGFLVEQAWLNDHQDEVPNATHVPVVLDWGVDEPSFTRLNISEHISSRSNATCNGSTTTNIEKYSTSILLFNCRCSDGYSGNPYLEYGCTDIDECKKVPPICQSPMQCVNAGGNYSCELPLTVNERKVKVNMIMLGIGVSLGGLSLLALAWWLVIIIKRRKELERKKEFYEENGGPLLEQELPSFDDRVDRCKLFSSEELDKATDQFSIVLGQGGQGTVYKGMLQDGRVVAVKRSKVVDKGKIKEFINEIVILSQVNHRNVVKLLGCCLETKVPLLVYEFIPNGTLFHYLHNRNKELKFTWDMRLRVAVEVAEALSYLHSAASIPIYHRDIKSTNILLDEMLRAKIADFGTSISLAIDQTHVITRVMGTFGYLDPEYCQSGQFTNKSDVYSFGVVLVELLTGDTPTKIENSGSSSLLNFIVSMKENNLDDILDAQVRSGKKEEIMAVASLAQMCLNLDGKKRPTMKEVAMVLERTLASQKECSFKQNHAEMEYAKTDIIESCDIIYPSTSSTFTIDGPSTDDQPLMKR